jgi:hypothetical protein
MEGRIQLAFLPSPLPILLQRGTPAGAGCWQHHLERAQRSMSPPSGALQRFGATQSTRRGEAGLEACGMPQTGGAAPRVIVSTRTDSQAAAGAETAPPPSERVHIDPAPVRVHVSVGAADGLRIWFGIDGNADVIAQRAAAALGELRRAFHGTGQRVSSVVCNGSALVPEMAVPDVAACDSHSPTTPWKDPP